MKKLLISIILIILVGLAGWLIVSSSGTENENQVIANLEKEIKSPEDSGINRAIINNTEIQLPEIQNENVESDISAVNYQSPLDKSAERISKKPFGIKISPADSPVQPERFSGYHVGVDFEILKGEQEAEIKVLAFCEGLLVQKGRAGGYGGYAVQKCTLNSEEATVLYGHLRESSIDSSGQTLEPGDTIGVLGNGNSAETDFERKHLHFSIHKGRAVNIRGYVSSQAELENWVDPMSYL